MHFSFGGSGAAVQEENPLAEFFPIVNRLFFGWPDEDGEEAGEGEGSGGEEDVAALFHEGGLQKQKDEAKRFGQKDGDRKMKSERNTKNERNAVRDMNEKESSKRQTPSSKNQAPMGSAERNCKRKFLSALLFATFNVQVAMGATVVGDLKDISIQALDTKIMFAPTNEVLVTPSGLSGGPPKVIESVNGQFSMVLEAGDYTVSLPLIPWRHSFQISVMDTNGTVNITNLLSGPQPTLTPII